MPPFDLIPSEISGTPIATALPLGVFGTSYVGQGAEGIAVLKVLGPGERLGDMEAFNRDAGSLPFEPDGEDMGQPVLRLSGNRLAVTGCLVGGSRLQDAAVRAGEVLDPHQELARRLRGTDPSFRVRLLIGLASSIEATHGSGRSLTVITPWNVVLDDDRLKVIDAGLTFDPTDDAFEGEFVHEDVRVYLAPEVERAMLEGKPIPESPAADVYAFAATTRSLLLNRVLRRQGGRLQLEDTQRYSEELEAILARCLSANPGSRPTVSELRRALEAGSVEWRPTATWPAVAATGMAIVLLLAIVLLYFKPEGQALSAQRAFLAAAQIEDLEARDAALEDAWVLVSGRRELIPEAKRMRAVHDYLRWSTGVEDEPDVERLLTRVEEAVVHEQHDALAHTMRVILGVLRRWELATEDGVQHGTHLLEQAPVGMPDLAVLAKAAATLDPATSVGEPQAAWLKGIDAAASETGALVRPLPCAPGATPISLQSGWVADLVAGRLLARLGRSKEAIPRLERAHAVLDAFASRAALGLALAQQGKDSRRARALLSDALKSREGFVELQLALARAALDDAHASQDPQAFAQAANAYTHVQDGSGGNQDLYLAARSGAVEATFYAQLARMKNRDMLPKAQAGLEALIKSLRNEAALQRRYLSDVRLALGVVLTRLGKARDAVPYLLEAFEGREVRKGWADLPKLEPTPHTRDRSRVVRALLSQAIPRLAEVRNLVSKDPSTARTAERDARARLTALLEIEEANVLGVFQTGMLRAEIQLTRAVVSRSPNPKLEAARLAYLEVREGVDPQDAPGDWVEATRGLLSVYKAMKNSAQTAVEKVAPLLGAWDDLRAFDALAAGVKTQAKDLRDALARLADEKVLESRVEALIAERKGAWNSIDVERPLYSAVSVDVELAALRWAIASRGPSAKLTTSARILVGLYYGHITRIGWATEGDQFVADSKRGLSVLEGAKENAKAPILMRHLNLIVGCAALRRPDLVAGQLGGALPWDFARDSLARACGATDFAALRSAALAGTYTGKRRAAALLADGLLAKAEIPRSLTAGTAIPKSDALLETVRVAMALDSRNAEAHLLRGLLGFAGAGSDSAKLEAVVNTALEAYRLAKGKDGEEQTVAQASRLACYATFVGSGDAGLQAATLAEIAEDGARQAATAFQRAPSAREVPANYGPAYWSARILLAQGDPRAARAYEAYGLLKGSRQGPPEASEWEAELAKAKR